MIYADWIKKLSSAKLTALHKTVSAELRERKRRRCKRGRWYTKGYRPQAGEPVVLQRRDGGGLEFIPKAGSGSLQFAHDGRCLCWKDFGLWRPATPREIASYEPRQ
jgi:hypothetical protein